MMFAHALALGAGGRVRRTVNLTFNGKNLTFNGKNLSQRI